jgi:enoyl-CoA hydratase
VARQNVIFDREGRLALLRINRPASLNALNPDTLHEIGQCVDEVRRDAGVRCLILTGEGRRAFVAGADIAAMVSMTAAEGRSFSRLGHSVLRSLEELPIAVIAAVNGFALGGGLEMALACDLVVAADTARFGQPEINLGVIPGFGGTQRLARRIGLARAREMIYGGEMIDAETALRYGLVNRVVPADEVVAEAKKLGEALASKAPIAIQRAKAAINAGIDMDLDNGCRYETEAFALTFTTEDKAEGMAAFLEKREAKFKGR